MATLSLNKQERLIVLALLREVNNNMKLDKDDDVYRDDYVNWKLEMDKEQKEVLEKVISKFWESI